MSENSQIILQMTGLHKLRTEESRRTEDQAEVEKIQGEEEEEEEREETGEDSPEVLSLWDFPGGQHRTHSLNSQVGLFSLLCEATGN